MLVYFQGLDGTIMGATAAQDTTPEAAVGRSVAGLSYDYLLNFIQVNALSKVNI